MTFSVFTLLILVAFLFAVFSEVISGKLLTLAVILVCVALLVR
jgi:hypothetical protein